MTAAGDELAAHWSGYSRGPDGFHAADQAAMAPVRGNFSTGRIASPWIGPIFAGNTFLLQLNGGHKEGDNTYDTALPLQECLSGTENNFLLDPPPKRNDMALDPAGHPGVTYWKRFLRSAVQDLESILGLSSDVIRKRAARITTFVQLVPYNSSTYPGRLEPMTLRSTQLIARYIKEDIIPRAKRGDALVLVHRAQRQWALTESRGVVFGKNPRLSSLTRPERDALVNWWAKQLPNIR